jgi:hypothetical protein
MSLEKIDPNYQRFTAGRHSAEQLERSLNKTSTVVTAEQLSCNEVDKLVADCSDIINPSFKEWYCKAFYKLGADKAYQLAKQARSGNSPAKYFSFLIRHELATGGMK